MKNREEDTGMKEEVWQRPQMLPVAGKAWFNTIPHPALIRQGSVSSEKINLEVRGTRIYQFSKDII